MTDGAHVYLQQRLCERRQGAVWVTDPISAASSRRAAEDSEVGIPVP
jgi:hypothetical protein